MKLYVSTRFKVGHSKTLLEDLLVCASVLVSKATTDVTVAALSSVLTVTIVSLITRVTTVPVVAVFA